MSYEGSTPISKSIEELSPARAFEIVNRYLGWGDPSEKGIWFVGIEEADKWGKHEKEHPEENDLKELCRARNQIERFKEFTRGDWYSCETTDAKYKPTRTRAFWNIASIVCKFSTGEKDYKKYRKNHLFREGCKVFQTNLFPLGKSRTTEWPPYYKDLFNFDKDNIKLYEDKVTNTRFCEILRRWSERTPQATICFGRGYVKEFKECFRLSNEFKNVHPHILCNDTRRILITQHFSSRWWNKDISEKLKVIDNKLTEWKLTLP